MSQLNSGSMPLSEVMVLECTEFSQNKIRTDDAQNKRNNTSHARERTGVKLENQPSLESQIQADGLTDIHAHFQESDVLTRKESNQEVPSCSVLVCKGELNSSLSHVFEDSPKEPTHSNTLHFDPCVAQVFAFAPNQHNDPQEQGIISNEQIQSGIQTHPLQNNVGNTSIGPDWLQVLSDLLARSREKKQTKQHIKNLTLQELSSNLDSQLTTAVSTQPPLILTSDLHHSRPEVSSFSPDSVLRLPLAQITNQMTRKNRISSLDPSSLQKGQFVLLSPVSNKPDIAPTVQPRLPIKSDNSTFGHANSKIKSGIRHSSDLNSGGEDSQMTVPLKDTRSTPVQISPTVKGVDDESKVFQIPLLEKSPVLDQTRTGGPMRESHNMKERRRRARIKEACDLMRQLVPGMSHKTDKATVFEFSARYIHFLKTFVGTNNDKDFLIKYNPY